MAKISYVSETHVKLTDEEFEVLNRAYHIMKDIASDLWINDCEDTEIYDYAYGGYSCIADLIRLSGKEATKE